MNFKDIQKAVHFNAVAHGFWDQSQPTTHRDFVASNIGEKVALIHSELSEFLEEYRRPAYQLSNLGEELADAVIRIMDLAEYLKIDLESAIQSKHERNKNRPYKHDKRF